MSMRAVSINLETNWSVNIAFRVHHVTPPHLAVCPLRFLLQCCASVLQPNVKCIKEPGQQDESMSVHIANLFISLFFFSFFFLNFTKILLKKTFIH